MYVTIDEFLTFLRAQELVEQSNWESSELFVNQNFVAMHVQFAASKINGALAVRYAVPVLPPPPQLKYLCMRIAHWSCEQLGEIRQHVQAHYEQALIDLDKLATGGMSLIGADGLVIAPTVDVISPGEPGDKGFSLAGTRGFVGPPIQFGMPRRIRPTDGEYRF